MNKEEFRRNLATLGNYVFVAKDLLGALAQDHLVFTAQGALDKYRQHFPNDEGRCAICWINDHYDSISASVRAALILAEVTSALIDPLFLEAGELIKEENKEALAND